MSSKPRSHTFKATIYKTGINFCVDVPREITSALTAHKGYINIKGTINSIAFTKSLVPVKNGLYRLFINTVTVKDIKNRVGETAVFCIEQDFDTMEQQYPTPTTLIARLKKENLTADFEALSPYRRKEVVRYLINVKTPETMEQNIQKLVDQLKNNLTVRVP